MRADISLNDENFIISINWSDFNAPTVAILIEDFIKQYELHKGFPLALSTPKLYLSSGEEITDIEKLHQLQTGEVRLIVKNENYSFFSNNTNAGSTVLPRQFSPVPIAQQFFRQPHQMQGFSPMSTYQLWKITPNYYEYQSHPHALEGPLLRENSNAHVPYFPTEAYSPNENYYYSSPVADSNYDSSFKLFPKESLHTPPQADMQSSLLIDDRGQTIPHPITFPEFFPEGMSGSNSEFSSQNESVSGMNYSSPFDQQFLMDQFQLADSDQPPPQRKVKKSKAVPVGHNPVKHTNVETHTIPKTVEKKPAKIAPSIPLGLNLTPPSLPPPVPTPMTKQTSDTSLAGLLKPAKKNKKKNKKAQELKISSDRTSITSGTESASSVLLSSDKSTTIPDSGRVNAETAKPQKSLTPNITVKKEVRNKDTSKEPILKKEKTKVSTPKEMAISAPVIDAISKDYPEAGTKPKKKNKNKKNPSKTEESNPTTNSGFFDALIVPDDSPQLLPPRPTKFQLKIKTILSDPQNQSLNPHVYDCVWSSLSVIKVPKVRRILYQAVTKSNPFNATCYYNLADHYQICKSSFLAEQNIRKSLILCPTNYMSWFLYGVILCNADHRWSETATAFRQALIWYDFCFKFDPKKDRSDYLQILSYYAYSLYRSNENKATVTAVMKYVSSFGKNDNLSIFVNCYTMFQDKKNLDKLLPTFPGTYRNFPNDEKLTEIFAQILDDSVATKRIFDFATFSIDDLLLFHLICRERGFVSSATYFCENAFQKDKTLAVALFRLMNLYIIQVKYNDAIHACRQWLCANLRKVFFGLPLMDLLNVIGSNSLPIDSLLSVQCEDKIPDLAESTSAKVTELWLSLKPSQVVWNCTDEPFATIITGDEKSPDPLPPQNDKPYTQSELDVLGVLFTLVKTLFMVGALKLIPPLIKMIEPLRYKRVINSSPVLQECEYYKYIARLLSEADSDCPRFMNSDLPSLIPRYPEIVILGECQVLSAAWRLVKIHNREVLFRVKHMSGLTMDHLSSGRHTYQLNNYQLLIDTIKRSSIVIFSFCEFDCKKKLSDIVDKDTSIDVVDCIKTTVNNYLCEIQRLKVSKEIFPIVHPVLPTTVEGRNTIRLFNHILKAECEKQQIPHLIELSDLILDSSSPTGLKPQYDLDNIHIHPHYLNDLCNLLESIVPKH